MQLQHEIGGRRIFQFEGSGRSTLAAHFEATHYRATTPHPRLSPAPDKRTRQMIWGKRILRCDGYRVSPMAHAKSLRLFNTTIGRSVRMRDATVRGETIFE